MAEAAIRKLCEAGDFAHAATRALEIYRVEIMSFLLAVTRQQADADDAFSLFCLALWRGLPGFRWQSQLRTWLYQLARGALGRLSRERAAARRELPIDPEMADFVALARSTRGSTSEKHDRLARLRDALEPDDRVLVYLRVNRQLAWLEIARVVLDAADPSADDLARTAALLRKRWQRLKELLKRELERGAR